MSITISDLNPNLTCKLCNGYLINSVTIVDCFHSFCKSCLLKHLETSRKCPSCRFVINKDDLFSSLKYDSVLQTLVYKIVPNLFSKENKRRVEFYKEHPQDKINNELNKFRQETNFWNFNDLIDISIEYLPKCKADQHPLALINDLPSISSKRRYLRVESGMKLLHLTKWIRHKFGLPISHKVVLLFNNEILLDSYRMIDLAYIFSKTNYPLNLYYYYYKIPNGKKKNGIKPKLNTNPKLIKLKSSKLSVSKLSNSRPNKSSNHKKLYPTKKDYDKDTVGNNQTKNLDKTNSVILNKKSGTISKTKKVNSLIKANSSMNTRLNSKLNDKKNSPIKKNKKNMTTKVLNNFKSKKQKVTKMAAVNDDKIAGA